MIILISIWLFITAKPTTDGQLVITPTYTVSCPIRPTPLSANWSSFQHTPLAALSDPPPHCQPTSHHSNIPHWPHHQLHHPIVRWPVITQTIPSANWSPLQCTLFTAPSAPPPHCRPTGHHSNIPCQLPHQPCHLIVSQLVITPMYPVGHPISPTTPLSADWPSPKPYHQLTGHHSNIPCWPPHQPVGQLVITLTYPVSHPIVSWLVITQTTLLADWSSLQCTLSATPSAPPPHCWLTGPHHSNIPCWLPH